MTTFNTGNPIGSSAPKDLFDNAENLDVAVNSEEPTWTDRLGKERLTIAGMEAEAGDASVSIAEAQRAVAARVQAERARDQAATSASEAKDYAGIAVSANRTVFRTTLAALQSAMAGQDPWTPGRVTAGPDKGDYIWTGTALERSEIQAVNQAEFEAGLAGKLDRRIIQMADTSFIATDNTGRVSDVWLNQDGLWHQFVIDRTAPRIAAALGVPINSGGAPAAYAYTPPSDDPFPFAVVFKDGELVPLRTQDYEMSGWGSSSMRRLDDYLSVFWAGYNSAQPTWPDMDYYKGGRDGQFADQMAARQGAAPAIVTVPSGAIPASGAVAVTTNIRWRSGLIILGLLNGVEGTLLGTAGSNWTFTRTTAGAVVPVSGGVTLVPVEGQRMRAGVQLFNVGKNNFGVAGADAVVINTLHSMFRYQVPLIQHGLVIDHFVDRDTPDGLEKQQILTVNAVWKRRYGIHMVSFFDYVTGGQDYGQPNENTDNVWRHTGIVPTAADLEHAERGNLPPSLAADAQHVITPVSESFCKFRILRRMVDLSWYPAAYFPWMA